MLATILVAALSVLAFPASAYSAEQTGTEQPPAAAGQAMAEKDWPPPGVVRPGPGIAAPRLVKDVKPKYTEAALKASVSGVVWMDAVVEKDGTVGAVRVTKSLDRELGLDDEAVKALKQWKFAPATKDGVAIPTVVAIEMTFKTTPRRN